MFWGRLAGLALVASVVAALVVGGLPGQPKPLAIPVPRPSLTGPEFRQTVEAVNAEFRKSWDEAGLVPAPPAPEATMRRRISLALAGTIPSLEELRRWPLADPTSATRARARTSSPNRTDQLDANWSSSPNAWTEHVLGSRRSADYLAERWARALVGTEKGPFIAFRRRRFVTWLADSLAANRPYDELVRQLITETGLRTDRPAVNFITVTLDENANNQPNVMRLAGRTARVFLGVRLDCVQCHDDHLGGQWSQSDFHQLAAFYSECSMSITGIHDEPREYETQLLHAEKPEVMEPRVPFAQELLVDQQPEAAERKDGKSSKNRREQLADWVTHSGNRAFARAAVNRVWAMLFGKPLVEPIDSIPLEGPYPPGLETLASDFIEHGYDLQRLIHLIVATDVFQLDSRADHELTDEHEQRWACFPVLRLRPEQVVGATIQACSLNTVDTESHVLVRLMKFGQQQDFIKRYGDPGADEFDTHGGTIPQRLLMMNGQVVHERIGENIVLNASTRITELARDHSTALDTTYWCVLGREPTPRERQYFLTRWNEDPKFELRPAIEDLYWTLLNSAEFSWNH